jgi:hypothetical protein
LRRVSPRWRAIDLASWSVMAIDTRSIPIDWPNRFLVALHLVRDLLVFAKHLFFAATVAIVLAETQG